MALNFKSMALTVKKKSSKKKSKFAIWYDENKEDLSAKRKKQYAEDAEYRQRAVENSRRNRRGERIPQPADAQISFSEAVKLLGIGLGTLRAWRLKKYFPEPTHCKGGLWFNQKQVELLKNLKEFFKKYGKRPGKFTNNLFVEVKAAIASKWNW